MRTGLVYKIENMLNNKVYVGQTVTSLKERWSGHRCDSKRRNTPLYSSMNKHKDELEIVFKISILEDSIPYEELDIREVYWISKLNSLYPNGYNLKDGGQSYITDDERNKMSERVKGENNPMFGMYGELNPFYGQKHSEETKLLISKMASTREFSKETRNKIGASTKMRHEQFGHPMLNKNHTDVAKEKISKAMKGRIISSETKEKMSQNHARKRSVSMIDKNSNIKLLEFDSMKIATEWLRENTKYDKAKSSEISMACSGKKKSAYGFKWVYLEGVETIL